MTNCLPPMNMHCSENSTWTKAEERHPPVQHVKLRLPLLQPFLWLVAVGIPLHAQTKFQFQIIGNSQGLSQIVDMDSPNNLLGTKEVVTEGHSLIREFFCITNGKESKLSTPIEFTTIDVLRLSDNFLAVGYAARGRHPEPDRWSTCFRAMAIGPGRHRRRFLHQQRP